MFLYYKILFFMILLIGSLISISSNSWMGMWMGLEINLLAFIPLIQENSNTYSSESSLKYFLTQALASMILMFTLISMTKTLLIFKNIDNSMMIIFNSMLLTKMGMAPFHFWFPEVIEGLNWLNCLILLLWQKITPMILVMYNVNFQYFYFFIIVISMLVSSIMALNQTSLRKIMAYSSINHMAWMISAMMISETIWFYYLIIYCIMTFNIIIIFKILNIFYYNQLLSTLNNNFIWKMLFSFNFLSLGGLPPFLGFLPKWLTLQYLLSINWISLTIVMVILTLLMLFIYTRLIFNVFILSNNEINYFNNYNFNSKLLTIMNISSIGSLIFFTLMFNFL